MLEFKKNEDTPNKGLLGALIKKHIGFDLSIIKILNPSKARERSDQLK
jgi:hypothetical protein